MRKSTSIIWIDDEPKRKRTADDFNAKFINVRGEDLAQKAADLLKGPQPQLVIIDHIVDMTTPKSPLFQRGSTVAGAIKEQWPSCPVIGVTNVDNIEGIDVRTKGTYDALFPFQNFRQHINQITAIKRGFALVARTNARSARRLVELLKPPNDDLDRVVAALPDDLKKLFSDRSRTSRLYRWVNHLMVRPGFLYDRLWSATFLGITELGFDKVSKTFEKARYNGVFAYNEAPRWWLTQLSELLSKCKPEAGEMSWNIGRRLPGLTKDHFSHCFVCGESFPEIVGSIDAHSVERHAMHLKCTVLDPRHTRELYFEDIRMMKEQ